MNNMQSYSSKYLLLLLVFCVLVLMISIVGVSFAIEYYDGLSNSNSTFADKNIVLKYEGNKNKINFSELIANSDDFGITGDNYRINFSIISDSNVKYTVGVFPSDMICFKEFGVKVALLDENEKVLVGGVHDKVLTEGVNLNELSLGNGYYLFSDKITSFNNIKSYTFIAYSLRKFDAKSGNNISNLSKKCLSNESIKLKILNN